MQNIKNQLNNVSHKKILSHISSLSDKLSIPAYVVGGYVRDLLLEKTITDIDIMVEGDVIEFSNAMAKALDVKNIVEFPDFFTVLIPYSEINIHVASARRESYRAKSRKPEVEHCSIEEDLSRREIYR